MSNVRRFGDYFLLKKIAAGGMAELFKAKKSGEKGFEKMLAIKMILPHLSTNDDFISMFIDEAKVAALLNHQNIVQIFDLGKIENSYCIVMEYVRGKDLRSVIQRAIKKKISMSPEHACLIASATLAGLGYSHRKKDKGQPLNIVHRDVSPQNIIITYEGEVKVVDFGIAKAATQSRDTQAGVLKGKLSYMSPEQAFGKPLDARSDIFSVGIVLYEMLTGRKLFQSDTDLGTLELVRNATVEPLPSALGGHVPKALEDVMLKALEKDPDDRYSSAEEMEAALQDVMRQSGYSLSGYSLSEYMYKLFKEEIEEELREEMEWDHTVVSDMLFADTAAGQEQLTGQVSTATSQQSGPTPTPPQPSARSTPAVPAEPSITIARPRGGGLGKVLAGLVALILVIGGAGFFGMKYMKSEARDAGRNAARQEAAQVRQEEPAAASVVTDAQDEPPATETDTEPEPNTDTETAQKPAKPATPAAPSPVTASFNSSPSGAEVYVDGEYVGKTPATYKGLTPGVGHKVSMKLSGHYDWTGKVNGKPGAFENVNADLAVITYKLEVNSVPFGARVIINGKDTGKVTPAVIEGLRPGTAQELELTKRGHETYRETVSQSGGGTKRVDATLNMLFGKLTINSKPWAFVHIEGENKGMTPLAGLELPVGEYEVGLENPKLGLKKKVKVVIKPNETTRVVIPLDQ
jgi:serine/threonine protein kinase